MVLLPGLLVARLVFAGGAPGLVPGLVFAFGASLVVNYVFVFSLAVFHAYARWSVIGLVMAELAVGLVLLARARRGLIAEARTSVRRFAGVLAGGVPSWRTPSGLIWLVLLAMTARLVIDLVS